MANRAAWIPEPKGLLKVESAPLPKPGPGEIVIKNAAVAINPVDWVIQDRGMFLQKYPNILGTDVAGEVYEVGEGVTNFKKGDRIIGHALSLLDNNPERGGFQLYSTCYAAVASRIPDFLDFSSAAVLPLAISTASCCLFQKDTLALPYPSTTHQIIPKSVLVWGGSSSVGTAAIQLAVGAGVNVVSVASKHNIEKVKELGASHVFDHSSPMVAEDIVNALQGTEYLGVCDCISTDASVKAWTPVFEKLGGNYAGVLPIEGLPKGIQGRTILATTIVQAENGIADAVWGKYLPEALQNGAFKAKPDPMIIGHGLESVQAGLDKLKKGVSFAKVVVTL